MSNDPEIRAALKGQLENVSGETSIPTETLNKAKRRRRYSITTAALGTLTSIALIFTAIQFVGRPEPSAEIAPASSPTNEESPTPTDETPEVVTTPPEAPEGMVAPPPVTVKYSDQSVDLYAWTYCYETGCVDGAPSGDLPDLGSPTELVVEFPLPDWSFTAYFTPAGEKCGRMQEVPLESNGDGTFVLRPAGHADTYDVNLFGRGNGDLSVSFEWTTPSDGPLPEPEGHTAILDGNDGEIDSYGVELTLSNLAETPEQASAKITVESADGNSLTFDAKRARGNCWSEGTVYWDGPDDKGSEAALLGKGPFDYTVKVILDGTTYVGTGTWPTGEIPGNEPSVSLDFTPALPALQ